MSKAEDRAFEAYPVYIDYDISEGQFDWNKYDRDLYLKGYLQGEKDYKLTWEDIIKIEELINQVHSEYPCGIGAKSFGNEVLEKFYE